MAYQNAAAFRRLSNVMGRISGHINRELGENGKLQGELAGRLLSRMKSTSPVGHRSDKGRGRPGPGEMRDAWRVVSGGDGVRVVNVAPHARVLERGRRRGITVARMLGSRQSKYGIAKYALNGGRARAEIEGTIKKALKKIR